MKDGRAAYLRELKVKLGYLHAQLLYAMGRKGLTPLHDLKKLYARAMARKWCLPKDYKFCEAAFYRLYSYQVEKYLDKKNAALLLTLALYDVERGDYNLTTMKNFVERGDIPTELSLLTGREDLEKYIPYVAGIVKYFGEVTPDLLAATWQIVSARTRLLPPLEQVKNNVILIGILNEMERRGYLTKSGDTYALTDEGKAVAKDMWLPPDAAKLKELKYVTPQFYVLLNAPPKNL